MNIRCISRIDVKNEYFDGKFTVKFKRMLYDNINVNADDVVADIACDNGRFLNMLAKKAPICGYGFDISEKMIEQANPFIRFSKAGGNLSGYNFVRRGIEGGR